MDAYIHREAAVESLNTLKPFLRDKGQARLLQRVMNHIGKLPAADVEPVVHGRLVLRAVSDVTSTFMCSECGREFEVANAYFGTPTSHPDKNYPYCNCGARMDGDGK